MDASVNGAFKVLPRNPTPSTANSVTALKYDYSTPANQALIIGEDGGNIICNLRIQFLN